MLTPKRAPYADTDVDAEETMNQINKLLRSYGITRYQWTTDWSDNRVRLRFAIEEELGKFVPIEIEPAMFVKKRLNYDPKTGKHEKIDAPNWAQSMRLLLHYLKAKFESIAYGLREVKTEFMADLVVRGTDGKETTMARALGKQLGYSKGMEPLELGPGGMK